MYFSYKKLFDKNFSPNFSIILFCCTLIKKRCCENYCKSLNFETSEEKIFSH
jgi:hypothetical protein